MTNRKETTAHAPRQDKQKMQQTRSITLKQHYNFAAKSLYSMAIAKNTPVAYRLCSEIIKIYYSLCILLFLPILNARALVDSMPQFGEAVRVFSKSFLLNSLILIPILLVPITCAALICYSIFWRPPFWRYILALIYQIWCSIIWAYIVGFICLYLITFSIGLRH